MERWLYRYRTVMGEPDALAKRLQAELRELLVGATQSPSPAPAGDGSFRLRLPAHVLGADLTKSVRASTGVATTRGSRLCIPVAWRADPGPRAFPSFEGTLELEPLSSRVAQLTLVGVYRLPGSAVGALADSTVLQGVAERTAEHLVSSLARALSEPSAPPPPVAPPTTAMRVADVMSRDPLVLAEGQSLRTAALLLLHRGVAGAPVVDDDGALVGVLSEADLMEKEARPRAGIGRRSDEATRRREALTVGEACSRPARVTAPDATLHDAARELLDHDLARLVVVEGSRVAGIVSRHDVLRALIRADQVLQELVDAELAPLDERELHADVTDAVVALTGKVLLRSRARDAVVAAAGVDGVLHVDADLDWVEDDVTPYLGPVA